jgi:hypothetical protein
MSMGLTSRALAAQLRQGGRQIGKALKRLLTTATGEKPLVNLTHCPAIEAGS